MRYGRLRWYDLLLIIALLAFIGFISCNEVYGERVDVPVLRQVQGTGVIAKLESRLPPGTGRHLNYSDSYIGIAHGVTHELNSYVRNNYSPHGGFSTGNAAFVITPDGGEAFVFPNPPVTITEAMRASGRTLLGWDSSVQREWNHSSGYVLDEFTCYCWGTVAGVEQGWTSGHTIEGSYDGALRAFRVMEALARLARQRGYSHSDDLDKFVVQSGEFMIRLKADVESVRRGR